LISLPEFDRFRHDSGLRIGVGHTLQDKYTLTAMH